MRLALSEKGEVWILEENGDVRSLQPGINQLEHAELDYDPSSRTITTRPYAAGWAVLEHIDALIDSSPQEAEDG